MTKKQTKYSNAGKGDKSRFQTIKKKNWEKIGKKNEKTIDDIGHWKSSEMEIDSLIIG